MFSAPEASRKFARLQRDQEILLWRYATADSDRRKQAIGLKILGLKLRQSLMGAFYGAVLHIDAADGDSWEEADRRRLREAIIHARALGPAAAVRRTWLMRETMEKWHEAKKRNDFSVVSRPLQGLVDSIRDEARFKAKQMGLASPYEALVRGKTPGFSMQEFEAWAEAIEGFARQALNILPKSGPPLPVWRMPKNDQHWIQDSFLQRLGFDFGRGRIAEAPHPMCLGTHDEVAIGMRYDENDFCEALLSSAHEGGHALYRQNLPPQYSDRLVGGIAGTGMDEAMALIIENHVGRNVRMAQFMADFIRVTMPEYDDPALSGGSLSAHLTRIAAGTLRTDADEVRYPLDIILRYKIEKALIDDGMKVADIPAYWAAEYERLTGQKVKDDNEGPLQDIHWFGGEFGWFPNYLIGQLAAAQLYEAALADMPDLPRRMQKGEVSMLTGWLDEFVYRMGARYTTFEIIEDATGRALDTASYFRHIIERYLKPLAARQSRPALPPPGPR